MSKSLSTREQVILEIENFLARSGMAKTAFGLDAIGNAKILDMLRGGMNPRIDTVDQIRTYIRERTAELPRRPKKRAAYQPAA